MKSILKKLILSSAILGGAFSANAQCWPARFEGVMLQGFFWDSYKGENNSKWTTLSAQSDILSQNFKVIWIPNCAKAATSPSMGYDPVYWFSNHTSSFGSLIQLNSMISKFNSLGTDIIEDLVVNHRSGVSTWTDFPSETWNGKTYKMGPEHICSDDEVASQPGQAKPTGNRDTGEGFHGSRDLDHTSPLVQEHVTDYCKYLLSDLNFSGFRWDMVKGFGGEYVKKYLQASKPKYSVGEYWDGNYDKVAAWIEATGRESAAFDFPLKYCINQGFSQNDMTKLVWLANGTPQPAGMIHNGYQRLSVTFVDNHDTYRDGSKFNGNVLAANAFILFSPGTPCVFLPHWQQYTDQISRMIQIRNAVGVHNESPVKVLKTTKDCYMAEVTGTKGKLVVKIGSAMVSPDGYTDADIKTTGNGYCVWTKTEGIPGGDTPIDNYPKKMYLIGNLSTGSWDMQNAVAADESGNGIYKWHEATLTEAKAGVSESYFSFITTLGSSWDVVNNSDRYGATDSDKPISVNSTADVRQFYGGGDASSAFAWKTTPGTYTITLDLTRNKLTLSDSSAVEEIETEPAAASYYNLQGMRVEEPLPGNIYIKVEGNKSSKVLFK